MWRLFKAAAAADAALARGVRLPLLGAPISVKEAINVTGLPTTGGMPGTQAIEVREDAPPGTPMRADRPRVDFAVEGPMARCAQDFSLALDVQAGPDPLQSTGWRLALPPACHQVLAHTDAHLAMAFGICWDGIKA